MTARKTIQPYGDIIRSLDEACTMLREHVEHADLPRNERVRLTGSLDSIGFERKIISAFEMAKTEGLPGHRRTPL